MQPLANVPNKLKPGMKHVVTSGETLNIVDKTGDSIAIVCKEHPAVLAFLLAFDELGSATSQHAPSHVLERLRADLKRTWEELPDHVKRELPSNRLIGLRLPT
jgi:hypothetical protein